MSGAYSSPGLAILRSSMMMLELDYMASFNDPYNDEDPLTLGFSNLTLFFVVLFVLLMPILLMNLLVIRKKIKTHPYTIHVTIEMFYFVKCDTTGSGEKLFKTFQRLQTCLQITFDNKCI